MEFFSPPTKLEVEIDSYGGHKYSTIISSNDDEATNLI